MTLMFSVKPDTFKKTAGYIYGTVGPMLQILWAQLYKYFDLAETQISEI